MNGVNRTNPSSTKRASANPVGAYAELVQQNKLKLGLESGLKTILQARTHLGSTLKGLSSAWAAKVGSFHLYDLGGTELRKNLSHARFNVWKRPS